MNAHFYQITLFWLMLAPVVALALLKIQAPYGKYAAPHWGLMVPNKLGWVCMELVALLGFAIFFLMGLPTETPLVWFFFACWVVHYIHRSLIYPFRQRTRGKWIPLSIVLMSMLFNSVNGFLNGYYFTAIAPLDKYTLAWLTDPRFQIGLALFVAGFAINYHADRRLLNLRKPGETGYKIPRGGLFNMISCPNYFGEIVEWIGFAVMTWSLPALAFALWTTANLLPRAISYHRWYHQQFANYPKQRKALLPFIL